MVYPLAMAPHRVPFPVVAGDQCGLPTENTDRNRVHVLKVPATTVDRWRCDGRKQTTDESIQPKQAEGMEKARVSHRSDR
jgi:hypothetical protein